MNVINQFVVIITIMLFYSFGITIYTYSIPTEALNHVTSFSDITSDINLESVSNEVSDSIEKQTDIPLIEAGALVFYSGNILIDLILNFAYAIPQMISLLIYGILSLISVDSQILNIVQLFLMVIISVLYFIGIMQLLINVRSGGRVIT